MDAHTRDKMKTEIFESDQQVGINVGIAAAFALMIIATMIPGLESLMKSEQWYWPLGFITAMAFFVGYFVNGVRKTKLTQKLEVWDDDDLKFAHDKVREKRILRKMGNYLLLAVVALFFLTR